MAALQNGRQDVSALGVGDRVPKHRRTGGEIVGVFYEREEALEKGVTDGILQQKYRIRTEVLAIPQIWKSKYETEGKGTRRH